MTGMFSGVLLASDYDGTLANNEHPIPKRVYDAVRFFREEGGLFTVCTGRALQAFHAYDERLVNAPVIVANGGMLFDYAQNRAVRMDAIGPEGARALEAVARNFPDVSVEMYGLGQTFCIRPLERSIRHFAALQVDFLPVETAQGFPFMKCMVSGEREEISAVQAFLQKNHPEIGFIPNAGEFLELLRPGVNKGTALKNLAEICGVSMEDVYAAGDGYNDCDMLAIAAGAFVPENGDEFAKACATHIVCANTQGAIADVIEILTKKYGGK